MDTEYKKYLEDKIEANKKETEHLQAELYKLENEDLFNKMESNIGKCFSNNRVGQGETEYVRIEDVNKKYKQYIVTTVHYVSMLIGWSAFTVSYGPRDNNFIDKNWLEISEDEFLRHTKQQIGFETKHIFGNENI